MERLADFIQRVKEELVEGNRREIQRRAAAPQDVAHTQMSLELVDVVMEVEVATVTKATAGGEGKVFMVVEAKAGVERTWDSTQKVRLTFKPVGTLYMGNNEPDGDASQIDPPTR